MDLETLKALTQVVTPIFLFGLGVASAVIAWFLRKLDGSIESRFTGANDKTERLERDLAQLKADLPRDFVLRDDYIRVTTLLETKLDKIINRLGVKE